MIRSTVIRIDILAGVSSCEIFLSENKRVLNEHLQVSILFVLGNSFVVVVFFRVNFNDNVLDSECIKEREVRRERGANEAEARTNEKKRIRLINKKQSSTIS